MGISAVVATATLLLFTCKAERNPPVEPRSEGGYCGLISLEPRPYDALRPNVPPAIARALDEAVRLGRMTIQAKSDRLYMFPNQPLTLRVRFLNPDAAPGLADQVFATAREWSRAGNAVRIERTAVGGNVRILFIDGRVSESVLGREVLTKPASAATMRLAVLNRDLAPNELRWMTLHEFGHALGLIHEYAKPHLASLCVDPAAVRAAFPEESQDVLGREFFGEGFNPSACTDFDRSSVMLYAIPDAWTCDRKSGLPYNNRISQLDDLLIGRLYPAKRRRGQLTCQ
ncbi:MAG: zinc metalloprotease [Thermoanaerobaculia bacterium]